MAWVIRVYDSVGRLLYVAGTDRPRVTGRLRELRREPWWGLVDASKTLLDKVEPKTLKTPTPVCTFPDEVAPSPHSIVAV